MYGESFAAVSVGLWQPDEKAILICENIAPLKRFVPWISAPPMYEWGESDTAQETKFDQAGSEVAGERWTVTFQGK